MSTLRNFRRGRGRRLSVVGATLVAVAAFGGIFVASSGAAPQACTVVGNFEIDGDMMAGTPTCTPAADDWGSLTPGVDLQSTTQGGTYSTSSKDPADPTSDPSTWTSAGSTPIKDNFDQAYATSRVVKVGGVDHFFVFVAWERTSTTGTQGYGIEITNTGKNFGTGNEITTPQPDRSNGGSVFFISAQGSSAPQFLNACPYNSGADYGLLCNPNASFTGAVNQNAFTDPFNNVVQDIGGFYEVALDVTGLNGVTPSCPGTAANAVYLRSYTGQISNGNLKAYMAPLEVAPNSTCVPPNITTTATPGGSVSSGDSQHDEVTVGGNGDPVGVGSVKFFLCNPSEVTPGGCVSGGTQVGAAGGEPLDVNGQASSDTVNGSSTPDDNAPGKYCWRSEFTPSADDHNYLAGQHTNSDSECFTILAPALALTKTADASPVSAGGVIGFTVTASNSSAAGTGTARDVSLSDPLPSGSGIDWSISPAYPGPGTCSITGTAPQTLNCSFGDLAAGATASVHVESETAFASCGEYVNTASLSSGNGNQVPPASASLTVQCPNLSLVKTADAATVSAGDQIGFTVTASNSSAAGTGTATGVSLSDPLPGGSGIDWSISPAYPGPGSCSITGTAPQTLNCSFGDLLAGATASVHLVSATAFASCGEYHNTASLSSDNGNEVPPASASTTVECPALTLVKTADSESVNAGDQIGFTVTASNSAAEGTGTAHDVVIDDPLPAGSGVDWSIDSGPENCSITGAVGSQTLHCSAVDLGPDESESVHVVSGTSSTSCATYPNVATLTASNHPTLTANASTTVDCAAIHIVKTADAAKVNVGSPIGFTMTVWNDGVGDARGVTLMDTLPTHPGLSWTIASQGSGWDGSCAIKAGVLSCGPATVPAGTMQTDSTFTVHITSTTAAAAGGDCPGSGTVDNTGSVTTTNDGSGQSSASTCVQALVDLSITKTGSPAEQTLGNGNITWTIVVTNHGPSADTGVTITDPMPAGNTFVSATTTQGTCTGGAVLTCNIGPMAAGASVTITLVTKPSAAGNQVNTVTVTGNRPETNTANNTASATVLVKPFTPPVPVVYCVAVSKVTPNQLFVGRKTTLTIHVTQHGKAKAGVSVLIKGPHFLTRTKRSNAKGVIKQTVKMKKAGAMIFTPIASKRCNTKRIGVTGVFTPPVTG